MTLIEQNSDFTAWQHNETFVRVVKEADSQNFEIAGEGLKFRTFEQAAEYAGRG